MKLELFVFLKIKDYELKTYYNLLKVGIHMYLPHYQYEKDSSRVRICNEVNS